MIETIDVAEKYKKNLTVHPVYNWDNLDIGGTKIRHHLCEIRIFSDRLYLQTLPGDFDSDLLERQSYKEAESLISIIDLTHVVHKEVSGFVCFIWSYTLTWNCLATFYQETTVCYTFTDSSG